MEQDCCFKPKRRSSGMAIQTDGVSMVGNTSIRLENPSKRLALLVFCLLIIPDLAGPAVATHPLRLSSRFKCLLTPPGIKGLI